MFLFFVEFIQPICLPILSKMREHKLVKFYPYVAGWGVLEFSKYFIGKYIFYSTYLHLVSIYLYIKSFTFLKLLFIFSYQVLQHYLFDVFLNFLSK